MPKHKYPTNEEIASHELLDDDQRKICRIFRDHARRDKTPFTMLDFARIALRATGKDDAEAGETGHEPVVLDIAHRRAAILYTYESLRACDIAIIKEWPEFDEMLKSLVTLSRDSP